MHARQPRRLGQSRITRWSALAAFGLLLFSEHRPVQAGPSYRLVVNRGNPLASVSRRDVSAMFLGKMTTWRFGTKVAPVDQSATSGVRGAFTREVYGTGVDAVVNYWRDAITSGRGMPPPVKNNDEQVAEFVRNNSGAIGYVSGQNPLRDLKAVALEP